MLRYPPPDYKTTKAPPERKRLTPSEIEKLWLMAPEPVGCGPKIKEPMKPMILVPRGRDKVMAQCTCKETRFKHGPVSQGYVMAECVKCGQRYYLFEDDVGQPFKCFPLDCL